MQPAAYQCNVAKSMVCVSTLLIDPWLKLSTIRTMLCFYSDDRKRLFVYIRSPVVSLDQKVLEQSLLNSERETSLFTYLWLELTIHP